MSETRALAKIKKRPANLVVAQSLDELMTMLIEDHGFVERSLLRWSSHHREVPDGVYVERQEDELLVWVPPDPERSMGNGSLLPKTVRLSARPHPRGHQLTVQRERARSSVMTLGAGAFFAIVFVASGFAAGPAAIDLPIILLYLLSLSALGSVLGRQYLDARARSDMAWEALANVLGPLAISGHDEEDPYRGSARFDKRRALLERT